MIARVKAQAIEGSEGSRARPSRRRARARPGAAAGPAAQAEAERATAAGECPGPGPAALDGPAFRTVGFAVSSIGYGVARRFRETLAPLDLEPREFAILRAVAANEGVSQQAAAERLQIPPSRMVAFVDLLESRGLMERKPRPGDRRSWALHLTRDGDALLRQAFELASGLERDLCAKLSDEERERLLDMLWQVGGQLGLAPGVHGAHADAALGDAHAHPALADE